MKTPTIIDHYGDITNPESMDIAPEAIVNAANTGLRGGGGVDGAIHRAAGYEALQAECATVREGLPNQQLAVGEAVVTGACALTQFGISYIIHTVGPDCRLNEQAARKAELLTNAYTNSLKQAVNRGAKTIAIPGISTGVYGYDADEAEDVSRAAIEQFFANGHDKGILQEVHRVFFPGFKKEVLAVDDRSIEVALHPQLGADTITIMMGGLNGHVDGWMHKNTKVAELLRRQANTAVVRAGGPQAEGGVEDPHIMQQARALIKKSIAQAEALTGKPASELTFQVSGYSAGGSGMAAVAHEFPQIKKMLLVAPSVNAGDKNVKQGLMKFRGNVAITVGKEDELAKYAEKLIAHTEGRTLPIHFQELSNVDHRFTGVRGGELFSASFLWGLDNQGEHLESSQRGIKLYN